MTTALSATRLVRRVVLISFQRHREQRIAPASLIVRLEPGPHRAARTSLTCLPVALFPVPRGALSRAAKELSDVPAASAADRSPRWLRNARPASHQHGHTGNAAIRFSRYREPRCAPGRGRSQGFACGQFSIPSTSGNAPRVGLTCVTLCYFWWMSDTRKYRSSGKKYLRA